MSVKCPRSPSINNNAFTCEEWDDMEATEQFMSEIACAMAELGVKYELHPDTAFSLAAGAAISMLVSPIGG